MMMKRIGWIFNVLIILVFIYSIIYFLDLNYIYKAVRVVYFTGHKTAFLEDYTFFENQNIKASKSPQPWAQHQLYNTIQLSLEHQQFLQESKSISFVVIKEDKILYERYWDGFDESSKTNSFSVTKSYVTALLGKAIKDGYVEGFDHRVIDILPELKGKYAHKVTLGDLASMSGGLKWKEEYYIPINRTSGIYFTQDLHNLMMGIPIEKNPGQRYVYQSGSIQLLGLAIAKATGKSLSDYLQESFFEPMGYQYDAFWQLDSKRRRVEKSFCCIASNAKDFARLAKLYKDYGRWNGAQILDSVFIAQSLTPRFEDSPHFGYGIWLREFHGKKAFLMRGHLGQYIITIPSEDLIIVRLGHKKLGEKVGSFTSDIEQYVDMGLEINSHL